MPRLRNSRNSAPIGLALVGLALGATAIGALAIGALAIGRLAIGRGRIDKLTIGELTVDKTDRQEQVSGNSSPKLGEEAFDSNGRRVFFGPPGAWITPSSEICSMILIVRLEH